jgi:hypothetical protein
MVANIRAYTPNYSFKLVNFDTPRWHTLEYANWTQLDSMLLQAGIQPIRGIGLIVLCIWLVTVYMTPILRTIQVSSSTRQRC